MARFVGCVCTLSGSTETLTSLPPLFHSLSCATCSMIWFHQKFVAPKKSRFGSTATGGPAAWTTYAYENVSFTFVSFLHSRSFEGAVLKKGEYVFPTPLGEYPSAPPPSDPGKDDFLQSATAPTEIVTISWVGRKCVEN